MTATYDCIATTTLGSATSSVTFSSISGSYTDLVILGMVANQGTAAAAGFTCRFNSDSGSNYSVTYLRGNGSSAASSRLSNQTKGLYAIEVDSTTSFSALQLNIMNYSNSTTYKTWISRSGMASRGTEAIVGLWRSTSAITSIELFSTDTGGQNFASGSTFSLFGIKAE